MSDLDALLHASDGVGDDIAINVTAEKDLSKYGPHFDFFMKKYGEINENVTPGFIGEVADALERAILDWVDKALKYKFMHVCAVDGAAVINTLMRTVYPTSPDITTITTTLASVDHCHISVEFFKGSIMPVTDLFDWIYKTILHQDDYRRACAFQQSRWFTEVYIRYITNSWSNDMMIGLSDILLNNMIVYMQKHGHVVAEKMLLTTCHAFFKESGKGSDEYDEIIAKLDVMRSEELRNNLPKNSLNPGEVIKCVVDYLDFLILTDDSEVDYAAGAVDKYPFRTKFHNEFYDDYILDKHTGYETTENLAFVAECLYDAFKHYFATKGRDPVIKESIMYMYTEFYVEVSDIPMEYISYVDTLHHINRWKKTGGERPTWHGSFEQIVNCVNDLISRCCVD